MYIVTVETLADSRIRVTATLPGARWEEGSATAKTEAEARDLLEWLLGAPLTTEARAERDVIADEHRDEWIAHQEALAASEGFGAEQPSDCDSIDPFAGIAPEHLTAAELDRAVTRDERRAYGVGL